MNVEIPTPTKKPIGMARLCTYAYPCQHKRFACDEEVKGKKGERPNVFDVSRRAEARKAYIDGFY